VLAVLNILLRNIACLLGLMGAHYMPLQYFVGHMLLLTMCCALYVIWLVDNIDSFIYISVIKEYAKNSCRKSTVLCLVSFCIMFNVFHRCVRINTQLDPLCNETEGLNTGYYQECIATGLCVIFICLY
jgi:hypothetical protein